MRAKSLSEVRDLFDPQKPLEGHELIYYVDRGSGITERIRWNIGSGKPQRIIFPTMRGNGNTTELNKIAEGIKNDFFVIYIDILKTLDPMDIEYSDILLLIGFKIYEVVKERVEIYEILMKSLEDWSREVAEIIESETTGIEAGINFILKLISKLQTEVSVRKLLRKGTERKLGDLIDIINKIIALSEEKINKNILVIVDSLDRIIVPERAIDLFYWHSSALTSLNCNIIYLASRIIQFRLEYSLIRRNYDIEIKLPNVKIFDREGNRVREGFDFMEKVALSRMERELITDEALKYAIEKSGGVIHDFIRIIKESAFEAHRKSRRQIEKEAIEDVTLDLRRDFLRNLKREHMDILREVESSGEKVDDPAFTELLHTLVILEYTNGETWYAVHPIIR